MIFVAGGTGRLGTKVVTLLRRRGEEVRVLTIRPCAARVIEVGGPENMTMTTFVDVFQKETGSTGKVGHIPPVAMRLMASAMKLVNPGMARQIEMSIIMDTRAQAFDALETRRRYPSIPLTRLDEVVRRDFANVPSVHCTGTKADVMSECVARDFASRSDVPVKARRGI